ncbi:MAG: hypothetical protein ACRD3O_17920 [Terriglobia bacterium]
MCAIPRRVGQGYEEGSASTSAARATFSLALKAIQEDAARKGLDRLSLREINAEIAAVRKARREKTSTSRTA